MTTWRGFPGSHMLTMFRISNSASILSKTPTLAPSHSVLMISLFTWNTVYTSLTVWILIYTVPGWRHWLARTRACRIVILSVETEGCLQPHICHLPPLARTLVHHSLTDKQWTLRTLNQQGFQNAVRNLCKPILNIENTSQKRSTWPRSFKDRLLQHILPLANHKGFLPASKKQEFPPVYHDVMRQWRL